MAKRTLRSTPGGVAALGVAFLAACSPAALPGDSGAPAPKAPLAARGPSEVRTPAEFVRRQPGSTALTSADGARLVHASGFSFDTGLARGDDAAAAFLALQGAAFGVTERHVLDLLSQTPAGPVGAVHVGRSIDGLPVFGGDLVVGVTGGKVFLVNATDVPPAVSGSHALGPDAAAAAARAAFAGREPAGTATVAAGWKPLLGEVRAVYRVDLLTQRPFGDWRLWVDGETGAVLFREDRLRHASAPGRYYEVSPVETAAQLCPTDGTGFHTLCASPVAHTFEHLVDATGLIGTQVSVWNCKGASAPTTKAAVTTSCSAVAPVAGSFDFPVDTTYQSHTDDFAAAMAYAHLDRHVSFFKTLDPALPGSAQNPPSQALNGALPALVNVMDNAQPFDNAYFSGGLDAMVFGQGANVDYAYDATVMYHEFTHGVVNAWGDFNPNLDTRGGLWEPASVNEGTADAMAASETGRSAIGAFIGPRMANLPVLRDMSDPGAVRTCKGIGTTSTRLGFDGMLDGQDGEEHDDGEIWNGFYWEVFDGLRSGGWKACGGACDAGPAIQYAALRLAAGTEPTFATYWQSMRSAASALFPNNPEVASYVQCVAQRHGMDQCDRTVPVYAGEKRVQYVQLRWSNLQVSFTADASGTGSFGMCGKHGSAATIHLRKGQPVTLSNINFTTGDATVASDVQLTWNGRTCQSGLDGITFDPADAGTWYMLIDSPAAFLANNPGYDIFEIALSATGVTARPAPATPATCTPPAQSLTIYPASATVAPSGTMTFTASSPAGGPYTWSLQTNASGGSIVASTGVYTAGATLGTDVVRVTDSASATKTATVTVANPPPAASGGGGKKGGCATGGGGGTLSILLAAALLLRRRRATDRSAEVRT
jgi:uncharacterized protein (TIGR03382 family)